MDYTVAERDDCINPPGNLKYLKYLKTLKTLKILSAAISYYQLQPPDTVA